MLASEPLIHLRCVSEHPRERLNCVVSLLVYGMTKILFVMVLVFSQLLACVRSESQIAPVASPNVVASETPSPEPNRTVLKEAG